MPVFSSFSVHFNFFYLCKEFNVHCYYYYVLLLSTDRQTDRHDTLILVAVYNLVRYICQSFDSSISFIKFRTK